MLKNRENQPVPEVTFKVRQNNSWQDITSRDLFAGKTVVVFSLPGAFTPTCSSSHVPRYNDLAGTFKANGVDDIICISVNDTFVMNEWKKDQGAEHIHFIPDGNGEFTDGMGMLVAKEDLGFGKRSWRYAMLVKNGIIEKMFIEPEVEGDPFEVSDADTMLNYINPKTQAPDEIVLVTKPGCSHCHRAKSLMQEKGLPYEEITLSGNKIAKTLGALSGSRTTPQIFINGKHLGGADDLERHLSGN